MILCPGTSRYRRWENINGKGNTNNIKTSDRNKQFEQRANTNNMVNERRQWPETTTRLFKTKGQGSARCRM